jgi:hypothetical protein|tara:strand:- start:157 stop:516 length:360 start_codon:yes stop_codon:yes gene_type:complete
MTNYTFKFKPTSEIKDKYKIISVEAKDKKAAKKKLLKELIKVNSDTIDVIELREYFYRKYMRLDLQLLIDDLHLVHEFFAESDVFKNDVAAVIAYLQENLVPEEKITATAGLPIEEENE